VKELIEKDIYSK